MDSTGRDFSQVYRQRFSQEHRRRKAAIWKVLVERFFQRRIDPAGTVVVLGCGFGEFLNNIKCSRRIGVDLNSDGCDHLDPQIEFHPSDIGELPFLGDGDVNCVFTSNVLEHLSDKAAVDAVLREAWRVLAPGGQIIAMGPNLRYVPGEYWDFWDHLVPITDRSLAEAMGLAGFRIVECIDRFLPYTTCSRIPQSPAMVRLYLCARPLWRLLGRQFLIRAEKVARP